MAQITLDELNRMDQRVFVAALGDIFEHAPWVAEAAHKLRPFPSLNELYEAMTAAVRGAGDARQMTLINGHPDLAGKAAREGTMTTDSKHEQSSAGLDRLSADEFAAFHRLNNAYREKFGMPFIVCVRRHGKDSISVLRRRIACACTAASRPTCSTLMADARHRALRSSFSKSQRRASRIFS